MHIKKTFWTAPKLWYYTIVMQDVSKPGVGDTSLLLLLPPTFCDSIIVSKLKQQQQQQQRPFEKS